MCCGASPARIRSMRSSSGGGMVAGRRDRGRARVRAGGGGDTRGWREAVRARASLREVLYDALWQAL